MDRPLIAEVHARLAPEGGGGIAEGREPLDIPALASVANEHGARFAHLSAPGSKRPLLADLARGLALPGWTGRNWDALEEVLAHPEPAHAGPLLIAWSDPDAMDPADAATFRSIVAAASAARVAAGDGVMLVVAGPGGGSGTRTGPESVPAAIRRVGRIHHVAVIVTSIETSLRFWQEMLGLELETVMHIPSDRVRIAFLGVGESKIELVEPTDDATGVARFLASKGEGFHHVCFEVENLAETLIRLEIDGLELIDAAPRRGAEGPVAFIHPRSCHGVLVELIEAPGGPAWTSLGFPSPGR